MRSRILSALAVAGVLVAAPGCGTGSSKVEGVVTLDGAPVEGATVSFVPSEGAGGPTASALTDAQGRFKVGAGPKDTGLPAGTYTVTVTKFETTGTAVAADAKQDPANAAVSMMKMANKAAFDRTASGKAMMNPTEALGPKSLLPEKYAKVSTSGLSVTLPPKDKLVEIKLSKN